MKNNMIKTPWSFAKKLKKFLKNSISVFDFLNAFSPMTYRKNIPITNSIIFISII